METSLTPRQLRERQQITHELELELEHSRRIALFSFYRFVEKFWHVLEPTNVFVPGWHIAAICLHLEAVARFEISKLVINMPPRHMKSLLCSVMFPAWVWLSHPDRRFIYCSYAEALATRDSLKTRMLIESDEYQELVLWKAQREGVKPWRLKDDNNQKKMFENTATGTRLSVGVGGGLTGQGGDYLMVDDPLNALDVQSDVALDEVNLWHDTAFSTRYNNPQRHAKVIVMQRLHENDLTGHVLGNDKTRYESLILPARYVEGSEIVSKSVLNWKDPRTKKGELLWPARFDEKSLDDLESDLNNIGDSADAQLQQDPASKKGALFPRELWKRHDAAPSPVIETIQVWDCAQKPGISNDYSVCATWVKTVNGYFIIDVWREKTTAPILQDAVESQYELFKPDAVVIEDKSAGSSLIQHLLASTTIPVIPYTPTKDKVVRATSATPTIKAGKVSLPTTARWVKDFITEHEKFPKVKHDDQVDTTSMAIEYFNKRLGSGPRVRSL